MRIRTQIILAAFVLAVLPLAAIVTYSYHSSRRALEAAYGRETDRLTRQMDRRLASIRAELDQRLAVVSALPLPTEKNPDLGSSIATVMGEATTFVDALEFQPIRNAPRPSREGSTTLVDSPASEAAPEAKPVQVASAVPATAPAAAVSEVDPTEVPDPPPAPDEAMVIELPSLPVMRRYVFSEEQKELVTEIGTLGAKLGDPSLDPQEREDIRKEMAAAQKELNRIIAADRTRFDDEIRQARQLQREKQAELRAMQRHFGAAPPVPNPAPTPAVAPVPRVAAAEPVATTPAVEATPRPAPAPKVAGVRIREATKRDFAAAALAARKTSLILGRKFEAPVHKEGEVVGQITARVSPEEVVRRVLGAPTDDGTEIPFAIDREGTLYARSPEEKRRLEKLQVPRRIARGKSLKDVEGWIVTTSTDPQSGLRIGVARPVGENLDELRRTAARNFSLGMGLILFALIGIVPLSNHLTRDVKLVTDGAERIAQGDLMTRLPVKSGNELGQLARAFNRMAEDLSHQQQRLVEQERTRQEQEIQQRLLAVEYERKSVELEDARRFQLSMLPKQVPQHAAFDVAVYTRTATEVGGDYYDFHLAGDRMSVAIGDATGHGAKAGTMVTVIKTLFAGYSGTTAPAEFLRDAAERVKRMDLGRMAMALSLGRLQNGRLTLSSAGMPPVLVHRASTQTVEELALSATPLGTLGSSYAEIETDLASGDTVLFLTDGFPELMNDAGQQLGYAAALDAFSDAARGPRASEVIDALASFAARWHGDAPPNDDVTFVVVRMA